MSNPQPTSSATPAPSGAGRPPDARAPERRREVMAVLPGLMLAMLLAMLDNMIVGTAMPRIVGELHGLDHFTWVVTAYVLGATVSTPIWGKLGDLYGRKKVFLSSIVIFLIGSALCGMAGSAFLGGTANGMDQLIGFRALQGLGAGGLIVGAMAIIGDLVPPRERGRYQGMMGAVMAVATVAGPLIGGFITDHASWRWAFYVNLPLGLVALVLLVARLHLPTYRTEHRIDWLGAGLLAVGITGLVLITTWGGVEYAWRSPQIIGLAVLSAVTLMLFGLVERRVPEPVVALNLFANRNFALISAIGFLLGFALFGVVNFLPLYQQTVQGASATNSGLLLLPMMAGVLVVSIVSGQLITRTGRYRWQPIAGGAVMVVGLWMLSRVTVDTTKTQTSLAMIVLGVGMGFLMQTTLLIAQNSVQQRDLGMASSAATFFRSIGGSFGISLFGALFNRRLLEDLGSRLGSDAAHRMVSGGGRVDAAVLGKMPAAVREALLHGISSGVAYVFLGGALIAVLVPVLALFIKEIPLRGGGGPAAGDPTGDARAAEGSGPAEGSGTIAAPAGPAVGAADAPRPRREPAQAPAD